MVCDVCRSSDLKYRIKSLLILLFYLSIWIEICFHYTSYNVFAFCVYDTKNHLYHKDTGNYFRSFTAACIKVSPLLGLCPWFNGAIAMKRMSCIRNMTTEVEGPCMHWCVIRYKVFVLHNTKTSPFGPAITSRTCLLGSDSCCQKGHCSFRLIWFGGLICECLDDLSYHRASSSGDKWIVSFHKGHIIDVSRL